MQEIQGQFILMDIKTFGEWMSKQNIRREILRIQNHHTWKPDYKGFDGTNHFRLLKGMKASHLKRKFSDIAQNITSFPDGTVAICRSFEKAPAGIKGANKGALCIEHIGNFDHEGDQMNDEHKKAILWMNAILCDKFDLYPDNKSLIYHHWYDLKSGKRMNGEGVTKTCPGTNFFGGNKVHDAEKSFIPQVISHLKKIEENLGELKNIRKKEQENEPHGKSSKKNKPIVEKKATIKTGFNYAQILVEKLNVRNGPSAKFEKKRYLLKNELIPIITEEKGWLQIATHEWIIAKYVDIKKIKLLE